MSGDDPAAPSGSMPRSAVATGPADFVLPVREISARLPNLVSIATGSRPSA
ncbi:MAG TPA: hypothetical protein VMI72_10600 [Roseiarcus sp.]|nr:hypothetical protein [Roseiarcus sp.]